MNSVANIYKKLADADSRAIVLPDVRAMYWWATNLANSSTKIPEKPWRCAYVAAQKLQKPDSETAAERKQLTDYLQNIDYAEEDVEGGNHSQSGRQKSLAGAKETKRN